MPGFVVDGVGQGGDGQPDAYYTYTWEIPWLFQKSGLKEPLIYCKDATLPAVTYGKEVVKGASLNYKFASDVTWEDCRVTFYDTSGLLSILQDWRKMVWTAADGLRPADQYKSDSTIQTHLPDGGKENQWSLRNSWPSVIRYGDLTYGQSDVKVVEVTITYDWAEEIPA